MPRAALSNVSLKQLVAELEKRKSQLADLVAQRDELNSQISELEGVVGVVVAAAAPAKHRGRPLGSKNKKRGPKPGRKAAVAGPATGKTLADYIKGVLAGASRGLTVKEIEAGVLSAGYPTKSKSLYTQVIKVLGDGFKKVARGVYALEQGVVAAATAAVAAPVKAAPKVKGKRGHFAQTAEEFVTGLLKAGSKTSMDINAAWKKAGRAGDANVTLSKMTKAKKVKRVKLKEGRGSTYTVA